MADFAHEIFIAADLEAVHDLIASHADQWWTRDATIDDREGELCAFRFPSAGFFATVRVQKNKPNLIEWRCIDAAKTNRPGEPGNADDPPEWVGTLIRFSLTPKPPGAVRLRLDHLGLGPSAEYYRHKNNVWAFYLESLKALAETGKGDPFVA